MATTDPRKTGFQIAPFLGAFAWASAPSASASGIGAIFRASDVGIAPGMLFVSDGTRWIPDGPQILGRSGVAVTAPADANENVLATVAIPAGAMGLDGGLLIYSTWTYTNSGNTKTPRVRLGGIGGTAFFASGQTTTATISDYRRVRNRSSASSQVGSFPASSAGGFGQTTSGIPTGAINTAIAQDLVFTAQKASAGETITLEQYEVWLTP